MTTTTEPASISDALADTNWKKAMDIEYETLMRNKTWHLVPPSRGHNIIDCRWVYKENEKLMTLLINTRLVSLLKATSNAMALIMRILLVLW
jgi:hypothetical protein